MFLRASAAVWGSSSTPKDPSLRVQHRVVRDRRADVGARSTWRIPRWAASGGGGCTQSRKVRERHRIGRPRTQLEGGPAQRRGRAASSGGSSALQAEVARRLRRSVISDTPWRGAPSTRTRCARRSRPEARGDEPIRPSSPEAVGPAAGRLSLLFTGSRRLDSGSPRVHHASVRPPRRPSLLPRGACDDEATRPIGLSADAAPSGSTDPISGRDRVDADVMLARPRGRSPRRRWSARSGRSWPSRPRSRSYRDRARARRHGLRRLHLRALAELRAVHRGRVRHGAADRA